VLHEKGEKEGGLGFLSPQACGTRSLARWGFPFLVLGFFYIFFGMERWLRRREIGIKILTALPSLWSDGSWSWVSGISCVIWSVFVFVGVVSSLALSICNSHHWQWLLLWWVGPLVSQAKLIYLL
jgi:ABC-type Fe3+ transport system permease subunit